MGTSSSSHEGSGERAGKPTGNGENGAAGGRGKFARDGEEGARGEGSRREGGTEAASTRGWGGFQGDERDDDSQVGESEEREKSLRLEKAWEEEDKEWDEREKRAARLPSTDRKAKEKLEKKLAQAAQLRDDAEYSKSEFKSLQVRSGVNSVCEHREKASEL